MMRLPIPQLVYPQEDGQLPRQPRLAEAVPDEMRARHRPALPPPPPPATQPPSTAQRVRELLRTHHNRSAAILLSEILGPPKALR